MWEACSFQDNISKIKRAINTLIFKWMRKMGLCSLVVANKIWLLSGNFVWFCLFLILNVLCWRWRFKSGTVTIGSWRNPWIQYIDVTMSAMTFQIASLTIVYSVVYSGAFRRRSKKTSKLRVTGLCEGNSPATGEFPAQRAIDAENISIWWRQHDR